MLSVMETGNAQRINQALMPFKTNGQVQYVKTLAIPFVERISSIVQNQEGRARVSAAISSAITSAMSSINLRMGMTTRQVFDLAELIIDQSQEDQLALEDILLFLQQLVTGQAGKIYDRMDIPTFFEFFEHYRQARHQALVDARYEQYVNFKSLGPADRLEDDVKESNEKTHAAISDHLRKMFK